MVDEPIRGRVAEARRNDERILRTALVVLSGDPAAPMSAVSRAAGVGQASLYRRYRDRESLLRAVCDRGLRDIAARVSAALDAPDRVGAIRDFIDWYAGSGTLRMTELLGTFTPTREQFDLARRANADMATLVGRGIDEGLIRPDVTGADLTLLATQVGALRFPDADRTAALRRRYVQLIMQGLTRIDAPPLPAPAPDGAELEGPWHGSGTVS